MNKKINSTNDIKADDDFIRFSGYSVELYAEDVARLGLKTTWDRIISYRFNCAEVIPFLNESNWGELYERGLAIADKNNKKKSGQYFTPDDVALVMCEWFDELDGCNVCDVGCGTGNLILSYLDLIGRPKAIDLINVGRLFLYDNDEVALKICQSIILLRYGKELQDRLNVFCGDFLDDELRLPKNAKVISNPPYTSTDIVSPGWNGIIATRKTKELYAMFMEKIIRESRSSVIITPYSFMGGNKFFGLRELMNDYGGFIVSFDNVPGNIFCGRKFGIFNSNTSNSVRAAITVVDSKMSKGFRLSPLIRFKQTERAKLLKSSVLKRMICDKSQIVDDENKKYFKCDSRLGKVFDTWRALSNKTLEWYVSSIGKYDIFTPNTCRYFTVASNKSMARNGQISFSFYSEDEFNYVFCLLNSSFAYWHWRLYDGGITYPRGLIMNMPVFFDKLSADDKKFFKEVTSEMLASSKKYIIKKNNCGVQENIKYPREYRDRINARILQIFNMEEDAALFDIVHSNMALEVSV